MQPATDRRGSDVAKPQAVEERALGIVEGGSSRLRQRPNGRERGERREHDQDEGNGDMAKARDLVFAVVAPCHPGAALRDLVLLQRGQATRHAQNLVT